MKKSLIVLLIVLIIILTTGCQNETDSLKVELNSLIKTNDDLVIQIRELSTSLSKTMKTVLELQNQIDEINRNIAPKVVQDEVIYINNAEANNIYQKALEIFYWFEVGTMDADYRHSTVIDNRTYFKVVDEITSYQELVEFMRSVFDYEIVEDLLSTNMYVDIDGELYGVLGDRGTNIFRGEETYEIIRVNEKTILYQVTIEVLGEEGKVVDYEINDFYLKYYTDGKWRFDKFYLMR